MLGGLGSAVCGGGANGGEGASENEVLVDEGDANAFLVDIGAGTMSSATVERDVPAVVRSDTCELCQVLLEYPLESDCLGSADLLERSKLNAWA